MCGTKGGRLARDNPLAQGAYKRERPSDAWMVAIGRLILRRDLQPGSPQALSRCGSGEVSNAGFSSAMSLMKT
jgi:hypothetical protein